jgi:hypothetical protein
MHSRLVSGDSAVVANSSAPMVEIRNSKMIAVARGHKLHSIIVFILFYFVYLKPCKLRLGMGYMNPWGSCVIMFQASPARLLLFLFL